MCCFGCTPPWPCGCKAGSRKRSLNMGKIKVTPCGIKGLYVIEPTVFHDERGYFMETYNQNDFKEAGLDMTFVQDNQSMSVKGVLRGLHYQKQFPQGKLVRAVRGFCPRLSGAVRRGGICLQVHGFLPSRRRRRPGLERPGDRRGLAHRRRHEADYFREGPEMGRSEGYL